MSVSLPWFMAFEHSPYISNLMGTNLFSIGSSTASPGSNGGFTYVGLQNTCGYPVDFAGGLILDIGPQTKIAFGQRFQYSGQNSQKIIRFRNAAGTEIGTIRCINGAANTYAYYNEGGTKVTGTDFTIDDAYNYIEFAIEFDSSTGQFQIKFNGTELITPVSSANTSTNGPCRYIQWGDTYGSNMAYWITHMYVNTWDGSSNAFYGPLVFYLHVPTSDVAANWTPNSGANNYSRVSSADGDTSYISTDVLDTEDQYGCTDLPGGVNSCVGVFVGCIAQAPNGGAPAVALTCEQNSVKYTSDAMNVGPAGTYRAAQTPTLLTAPDGSAWTEAKVNAMLLGIIAA